jgi:thiol-disulfide isomerase/thioredoxin
MRKLQLIFLLNFFTLTYSFADVVFIEGDLKMAKQKAAREGKLIFLDFWASYCTPCRMMEEYTFSDPSVSDYVREHYIPVKVDIQSFDGYDLKNQYNISLLPTIIVLNSKGVQVGRHEETFSASRFVSVLQTYNQPKNRLKLTSNTEGYNKTTGYSNLSTSARATTPKTETNKVVTKETRSAVNAPLKDALPTAVSSNTFTVQIGAYSSENELKAAVGKVKERFSGEQRMFVSKRKENNKLMYRVLVGHFSTRQQAASFLQSSRVKELWILFNRYKILKG